MNQYVIALGMFDGVHLGHQELLNKTSQIARSNGDTSVVFTYRNHPRELFNGSFDYLTPLNQRVSLYRAIGIDRVDAVDFTQEFADQDPEAFLKWLSDRYDHKIGCIVCGYDYRFGKHAYGDQFTLQHIGSKMGFKLLIVPPVNYLGEPCSSTRVRNALKAGEIEIANEMLNRPYVICGKVIHNKAIGRKIGFPTANVHSGHQLLPADGVYATALKTGDSIYASVTNIGANPTVGGEFRTIETHVPDMEFNLYGLEVSVAILKRIRNEILFSGIDQLSEQISKDVEEAKKVYKENEKSVYKLTNLW
jgi:riboflavin kinase/FMN adenylyltransferase